MVIHPTIRNHLKKQIQDDQCKTHKEKTLLNSGKNNETGTFSSFFPVVTQLDHPNGTHFSPLKRSLKTKVFPNAPRHPSEGWEFASNSPRAFGRERALS